MSVATPCRYSHRFGRELTPAAAQFVADALRRTYPVEALDLSGGALSATFAEAVDAEAFGALMRRLEFVTGKMTERTLYENRPSRPSPPDPFAALVSRRDVLPLGPGLFVLQGEFLRLQRHFDEHWRAVALDLGAVEQDNPGVWPVDLYRKIDYFADFPQQVIMAAGVRPHHDDRAAVARAYSRREDYAAVATDHLAPSTYGLQCAVCDSCYYVLQGARDHLDTLYTTRNKVFRNECSATGSLDRLTSFTVRDIMFVGSEEFVLSQRQTMLELAVAFLDRLDLDATIAAANDPFFTGDAMAKTVYQNAAELKHELLVTLPGDGRQMAIGSLNLHQDFFGRCFDIALPGGGPAWSGCLGIGFERLVYGLYAQYGVETAAWPAHLRQIVEK
jgi:hypothetical protein